MAQVTFRRLSQERPWGALLSLEAMWEELETLHFRPYLNRREGLRDAGVIYQY